MGERVHLDELTRLLARSDDTQEVTDAEAAAAALTAYLTIDRLWAWVDLTQAAYDLVDNLHQYEGRGLTALDAALDAFRKKARGEGDG